MKSGRSRPRTALAFLLSASMALAFAGVADAAEEAGAPKTQQVQKLIADLGSKDFETARHAAVALGNSGDTSAVPALIRAAVGDVLPELVVGRSREEKIPGFDDRAYAKAAAEAAAGARGKVDPKDFTTTRALEIKGTVDPFQTPLFREAAVRALGKLRSADALAP
jgi:HEAT repeat protein